MIATLKKTWLILTAIVVLSIGIFIADLIFPPEVASGVPYGAVVLLSLWLGSRRAVFLGAGATTALAVIGFCLSSSPGQSRWIGLEDRIIAIAVIWVTASMAAVLLRQEDAIYHERDFNKSLVETASSIILLLDPNGRIIHFNRYTTEMCGYTLAEVQGKDWFEVFVPAEQRSRARQRMADCVAQGLVRGFVSPVLTKEGQRRQISWSLQAIKAKDGQLSGILRVGQDITPLLEAQQKAVQSERLAAIGQTITAMTHEARNELAALQLTLRVLDAHVTDDATRQLTARLWDVQGRLSRLLEDVRGYAAPIHLEKTFTSVADIWRAAWESLKPKHCGPTELVEKTSGLELCSDLDSLRIEQVFRNLFDNSLAACTPPVVIEVSCTEITEDGRVFLQISIRDNGPGLAPDVRRKVFEPFFTTKPGGTGLGMPICKRIVEAHGGDLRAVDREEGAEFVLLLPKVKRAQEEVRNVQPREVG